MIEEMKRNVINEVVKRYSIETNLPENEVRKMFSKEINDYFEKKIIPVWKAAGLSFVLGEKRNLWRVFTHSYNHRKRGKKIIHNKKRFCN